MWSGWPELLDIYLSYRFAMLRTGAGATAVVPVDMSTESISQMLEKLSTTLSTQLGRASRIRRRKLRVSLSAGVCPAIGFTLPDGVRGREEMQLVAQAAAHAQLGIPTNQACIAVDLSASGVAAVLPVQLFRKLDEWSIENQTRLLSIRPLWSVATECIASRAKSIDGLVFTEPDAVTCLCKTEGARIAARTSLIDESLSTDEVRWKEWFDQSSVDTARLLRLEFGTVSNAPAKSLPTLWSSHWVIR